MVAFAGSCLLLTVCPPFLAGDHYWDVALSLAFGHDTRHAPGYSEGRWLGLRRGMTHPEVDSMVGPPLRKMEYKGGQEVR